MRYKKTFIILAVLMFSALFVLWQLTLAKPPLKPGNPGLPGCLAEVATLQDQVDELTDLVEQLQSQALVPQTGQTTVYKSGDDGDLQRGVECPEPRFTDNLDGTVTDNCTGLVWLQNAKRFGSRSWTTALNDCNALAHDGVGLTDGSSPGDWHLPNIRELHSLVHFGFYKPALSNTAGTGQWTEGDPFSGLVALNFSDYYWSATTFALPTDNTYAWYVGFRDGDVYRQGKSNGNYVWCVRDGN